MKNVLLITTVFLFAIQSFAQTPIAGITTEGEGVVTAVPDMATLSLSVVSSQKSAHGAVTANSAAVKKVLDDVKAFGVDKKDVRTSDFSLSANYVYPKDQPARVVGYTVSSSLEITVKRIEDASRLLDALIASGANRVEGVTFDFSNRAALLDQARDAAVRDAKRRAQIMASAADIRLGGLQSLSENVSSRGPIMRSYMLEMKAAPASVPLEPGQHAIKVNVTAIWNIPK